MTHATKQPLTQSFISTGHDCTIAGRAIYASAFASALLRLPSIAFIASSASNHPVPIHSPSYHIHSTFPVIASQVAEVLENNKAAITEQRFLFPLATLMGSLREGDWRWADMVRCCELRLFG